MRDLSGEGTNPYSNKHRLQVTEEDFCEFFGKSKKFTIYNPNIRLDVLDELIEQYWCCYEIDDVTNDTFQKWFILGFIEQKKGVPINLCKGAPRTAKEKWRHQISQRAKSGEGKTSELSATAFGSLDAGEHVDSRSHIIDQDFKASSGVCPYGVSAIALQGVDDVLETFTELLTMCQEKVVHVQDLRQFTSDKIGRFELNMGDCHSSISDYKEMIVFYDDKVAKVHMEIEVEKKKV